MTCLDCRKDIDHCHGTLIAHADGQLHCHEPECTNTDPVRHTATIECAQLIGGCRCAGPLVGGAPHGAAGLTLDAGEMAVPLLRAS